MRRWERGASPVPFVIFLVLWLVACYFVYDNQQKFEKQTKDLERKKVANLRLGDTVPQIWERTAKVEAHMRDLKVLLGYGGSQPNPKANLENLPPDVVCGEVIKKLQLYFDTAKAKSGDITAGSTISRQDSGQGVELRVNGHWMAVPIMGDMAKIDKLKDRQYSLTLQNVLFVLLEVHSRLDAHQKMLKQRIETAKYELGQGRAGRAKRKDDLERAIREATAEIAQKETEKARIEQEFSTKINAANEEQRKLEGEAAEIEEQYKRAIQVGKRDIQSLRNQIVETNRQKASLREQLSSMRVSRDASGVRQTMADLLRSAIETDEPDGEIAYATSDGVFLNIGRANKVIPGLKFFAYSQAPGGGWAYRGKIEVIKVLKDDIAQARVIHQQDQFNPLSGGDRVFNKVFRTPTEVFNRGPIRLTFIGKFPRHQDNMRFIKRRLEECGTLIQDGVTHWSEVVVVDDRDKSYEQDDEYLRATRDLNVEVMTMDQLREFLEY